MDVPSTENFHSITNKLLENEIQQLRYCKYNNENFIYQDNKPPPEKIFNSGSECGICYGHYQNDEDIILLKRCCHHYHKKCIMRWFRINKSCPMCRKPL